MRLNLASDEIGRVDAAPRVAAGDPLPPEDRVPPRAPIRSLEALYRTHAPRLLRFFSRRSGTSHLSRSTKTDLRAANIDRKMASDTGCAAD